MITRFVLDQSCYLQHTYTEYHILSEQEAFERMNLDMLSS